MLTTAFTGVAAGLVVLLGSGQALAEVVQTSEAFENGIAGGGSFSADATATDAGEQGAVAGARFANLPGSLNTLVLTFTVSFAGTVGLIIDAAIRAESTANGSGNSASAAVSGETTTIAVERIG